MKTNLLVLVCCLAINIAQAAVPKGWTTDVNAALKTAKEKNTPVLLYFTADWCGPCKLMASKTFPDPNVQAAFKTVQTVGIDVDAQPGVAQKYKVNGIPAFVLLKKDGTEVKRTVGFQEAKTFTDWIKTATKDAAQAESEAEAFLAEKAAMEKSISTALPEDLAVVLPKLFSWCADKNSGRKEYAIAELRRLAASHPKLLLPGLQHEKLATRIEIQKLLAVSLPPAGRFDPWATAEERHLALQELAQAAR